MLYLTTLPVAVRLPISPDPLGWSVFIHLIIPAVPLLLFFLKKTDCRTHSTGFFEDWNRTISSFINFLVTPTQTQPNHTERHKTLILIVQFVSQASSFTHLQPHPSRFSHKITILTTLLRSTAPNRISTCTCSTSQTELESILTCFAPLPLFVSLPLSLRINRHNRKAYLPV